MKTPIATLSAPISLPISPSPEAEALADASGKLAALVELTKPRLTFLVLLTVTVGYFLGARGASHPIWALWTVLGTGMVAAGASAWNQLIERDRDALMRRTLNRPVPSGRVSPFEAGLFGTVLALAGTIMLAFTANMLAAGVAFATFVLYVCVYTPLKSRTTLNTAIGAIPGALPPVIGWAAATDRLGIEALALFLIVFLWQFPHFLAIAWIHRGDYEKGGYKMLPSIDPNGTLTARHAVSYALALVPAGLLPTVIGLAGPYYFLGSLVVSVFYLVQAVRFLRHVSESSARRLLWSSFLYLPAVLALLLANPMPDGTKPPARELAIQAKSLDHG